MCIFGVTSSAGTLQFLADANWINPSAAPWLKPALQWDIAKIRLDGPPRTLRDRAIDQVWLI
ncbi:MAG: hypothetical protein R3C53_17300 [Pirellulaceae bacterium]